MKTDLYCYTVEKQLAGWRQRLYDVIHHLDGLHLKEFDRIYPSLQELREIHHELGNGMAILGQDCPVSTCDLSSEKDA